MSELHDTRTLEFAKSVGVNPLVQRKIFGKLLSRERCTTLFADLGVCQKINDSLNAVFATNTPTLIPAPMRAIRMPVKPISAPRRSNRIAPRLRGCNSAPASCRRPLAMRMYRISSRIPTTRSEIPIVAQKTAAPLPTEVSELNSLPESANSSEIVAKNAIAS